MKEYYDEVLSGYRLKQCYDVAAPRVKQYLEAEIKYVLSRLQFAESVLELGCGYGRITMQIANIAKRTVGIDFASESIEFARLYNRLSTCKYMVMNALDLQFSDGSFDSVVCLQNGICAFNVDQELLLNEALRVTRKGGIILFSSYSDRFWSERLGWFEAQAAEGLIGEIDYDRSENGIIACKDGLRIGRMGPKNFKSLCSRVGINCNVFEIDDSSVFCEIIN